jgi:hypothetical protein
LRYPRRFFIGADGSLHRSSSRTDSEPGAGCAETATASRCQG